jgi:gamma-glutamylcyclotransferase (GGCT)/AIG2-like uncharacterized protein YtfP
MKHLVFVYGSLKQGMMRNNHLRGQRYIGVAKTEKCYALFQLGGYPALIDSGHAEAEHLLTNRAKEIWGELYEVDAICINELDKVESVDQQLFERRTVRLEEIMPVMLPSCQEIFTSFLEKKAEAYFYKKPIGGAKNCGDFWSHR